MWQFWSRWLLKHSRPKLENMKVIFYDNDKIEIDPETGFLKVILADRKI